LKLSPEQIGRFHSDGFLVVEQILSDEEIDVLSGRAEWVASGQAAHVPRARLQVEPAVVQGERGAQTYADSLRKMSHMAFYDGVFETHARNPKVLDVIESILGPDIKFYQDQLFMKPPKIGSRQPYHQDAPLGFHIDPPDMVSCWTALDEATIENGCLWMLPGSHKQGITERSEWKKFEQRALEDRLPTERPVELNRGDCSFHHGLILHSSRPNLTEKRRRGYATHYVSARCRYTGPPEENDAMLVRGRSYPECI
jgi:phytanoyl-CoA hydroxylase